MARTPTASRRRKIIRNIQIITSMVNVFSIVYVMWYRLLLLHLHIIRPPLKTKEEKRRERMNWVFRLTKESDTACISELRMNRRTFGILCEMVRDIGDLKDNNVYFESISSPTASHNTDVTKSITKRKQPLTTGDKVAKKKRSTTTHLDIGTQLQDMNNGFRTFVDGFNANFATIANVMAEENLREKMAAERMKGVIAELMNLSLSSGDVFKAANIFTADKDKIDVLLNLPSEFRRNYVVSLLVPFPNM